MANIVKPSGINALWAAGGTKVDPGLAKSNIGWVVELPPYQYANWLENRQDTFIAHINQHGIPEWDAETEYQGNLSYTQGSDGKIYKCSQTHTNRNPVVPTNSNYWAVAFEVYGSVAVVQNQLTAHLNNYATLSGIGNLVSARANLQVYSRTEGDARYAKQLGDSGNQFLVANATQPQHAVPLSQLNTLILGATEANAGILAIATLAEVEAGVVTNKAVTPNRSEAVYLKKSRNLADVPNKATARTNLGLGSIATANDTDFLKVANNLSDVVPATARANLGLTSTATQPETYFLRAAQNLADVPSPATARTNLGLTSLATTNPTTVLFKADNLAGLTNPAQARANLGLSDSGIYPSNTWLVRTNNLGDLTNVQAARNNLGLSAAATMPVALTFNTGLDFSGSFAQNGYQRIPGGLILQWGIATVPGDGSALVNFNIPFPNACLSGQATHNGTGYNMTTDALAAFTIASNSQFYLTNGYGYSAVGMHWFAIGY